MLASKLATALTIFASYAPAAKQHGLYDEFEALVKKFEGNIYK